MKIDLSQFRETFLHESADHIASIESHLLALRTQPGDTEILNTIFRSAHSIKGGAGSFGFDNLVRFTHGLESLLDRLRNAEITASEEVIAILLDPATEGQMPANADPLLAQMNAFCEAETSVQATASEPASAEVKEAEELAVYRVEFRPDREIFQSATNPIVLLRNLADLGRVSAVELHQDALPPLADLDPGQCYLAWTVEMATLRPVAELQEVFEFVEHLAEIRIVRLDAESRPEEGQPSAEAVLAFPAAAVATDVVAATPGAKKAASRASSSGEASSIRVSTDKVDRLIDLVGELVIAHVMTAQMVEDFTPECLPKLRQAVAAMERNTRELHERVMAIRMLPVGTLFQRYVRTVYDIGQATGKQIRLELGGEETEIDKSMLEALADPLTHLIRNAADHGIETTEQRIAAGKPQEGVIELRAFHRSGRVILEIIDDGAGVDPARVRAKAIERGLILPEAQLSDDQLRMMIFEPGFSTRDAVSEFSGRGVGMDVVKKNVQRLNGVLSLESEVGKGTTITIELPLTLAILEGLLVRVADRTLVLPLLSVVETVSPSPGQIQRVAEQGEVVLIRDQTIPLLRLERFLGLTERESSKSAGRSSSLDRLGDRSVDEIVERTLIVVVEAGRKKIGLVLDELLGQQQVVVKSLERHLHKVDGIMGATILGDGCVAPIVDVAGLAGMNLFSLQAPRSSAPSEPGTPTTQSTSPMGREKGETANAMV
jgi:two-component system chemotaxis sensor kinase CheA